MCTEARPLRAKYSYRAVALLREDDRVLLQRGIDDDCWALPGGGVEIGESAEATVRREFLEEIGQDVRVGKPIALVENAFQLDGEWQRQIEIYFKVYATGGLAAWNDALGNIISRESHLKFRLFSERECADLDIRPAAAQGLLFSANEIFAYFGAATSDW